MTQCRITERLVASRPGGSLVPYFTSGFPDVATTAEIIRRADRLQVAAVEIGIPYSDSIADGPVIQTSFHAALSRGHRVADSFRMVAELRPKVECALIAMLSYSIVHKLGPERFMADAANAGFDGLILPDVPIEEARPISAAANRAGLCHIGLVAPTTDADRRRNIVENSSGFVYQIAASGTTGERVSVAGALEAEVAALRQSTSLPICVGFGISTAEHVRSVCRFADGAIVGSALVRRISEGVESGLDRSDLADSVEQVMADLLTGTTGRD